MTTIKKQVLEIFKKDKRTFARLNKNIEVTDAEFIQIAKKMRPSNKLLKELISKDSKVETKVEAPKVETKAKTKAEAPKVETKVEAPEVEAPKAKTKVETPEVEAPKAKTKVEAPKVETIDKTEEYPGIEQLTDSDIHPTISEEIEEIELENKIILDKEKEKEKGFIEKTIDSIKSTIFGKKKENDIDNKPIKYIMESSKHISLFMNNEMIILTPEHENFEKIKNALLNKEFYKVNDLINVKQKIKKLVGDSFVIEEGNRLYYKGELIEGILSDKIIELALDSSTKNKTIYPFLKFLTKVKKNPDKEAVKDLYEFLKKGKIPITRTGNIVTYKKITKDWKDVYTKKIDNSIGQVVKMDRKDCNSNRNITCSNGLHVASYSYMSSYLGDRIVLCEVNPKNVVSVPIDYNNAKMRCCEYRVIKEVTNKGEVLKNTILF